MTTDASIPGTANLTAEECWKLQRNSSVGRLAVWVHDHPEIFPINCSKDHFLRIVPEEVSGRRFKIAAPLTWGSPLDEANRAGLE